MKLKKLVLLKFMLITILVFVYWEKFVKNERLQARIPFSNKHNTVMEQQRQDLHKQLTNQTTPQKQHKSYRIIINGTKPYFLTAAFLVRIYKEDKPKLTTKELGQWMQYMNYAGIQHVYLYDNYKHPSESLQTWCNKTFPSFVTYHDWSQFHPFSAATQPGNYQHALDHYKGETKWQIAFDMDEYPFSVSDTERGFLTRFINKHSQLYPYVSEFSLKNFLFLGKPSNKTYLIERILRRTPSPANLLDKPLYKTECIKQCAMHHNQLKCGVSMDVDPKVMRMNHYWGGRLQNWGDDTPEIINKTIPDTSILELLIKLKRGQ